MAKVILTELFGSTSLGAECSGEVEFIATDKKGKIVGVKKLSGMLRNTVHSFDVGGKTATQVTAATAAGTTCTWRRG